MKKQFLALFLLILVAAALPLAASAAKSAPVITVQPASVSVAEGNVATFKVTAKNAESYQWYYRTSSTAKWTAVSKGGTTDTRSISAAAKYNGYQYRCVVKNSADSVTSEVATLKVQSKPVITVQPKSVKANEGTTATFKVTAEGAKSYQWYFRTSSKGEWKKVGTNGTTASRKVTAAAKYNGYQYRCLVKNSAGSVYTNTVTLTVNLKPVITAQPKSVKANEGTSATFKVTAEGATGYQWYFRTSSKGDWKKVSTNGTSASRKVTAAAKYNGYQYRCLVKNSAGSVYTNTVTLTVNLKPVITVQPKSAKVNEGKVATFKVTAEGAKSYQWYYRTSSKGDWKKVSTNGTTDTRKVTAAVKYNGYQYRCLVKNSAGSVYTNTVTLTVNPKPVITVQPKSATVDEGKAVTFKLTAEGATSYQWYYRTSSKGDWKKVSTNGTSASRKITAAVKYNGYQYRCLVKNSAGSVYSNTVTLKVNPIDKDSGKCGDKVTWKFDAEGVLTISGTGAMTSHPWEAARVTKAVISSGVTSIAESAFSGCKNMKSVSIASTVTSIGKSAFSGCTGLKTVTIPTSVTKIESETFSGCSSLKTVKIPDGVTVIGKRAFYKCTSLATMSSSGK